MTAIIVVLISIAIVSLLSGYALAWLATRNDHKANREPW